MREYLWDFFVDAMTMLFMPLVCSYLALCSNPFLNVAAQDAKGLEKIGNTLLVPVQYLLDGREAIPQNDGSWKLIQRFSYKEHFWLKTATSIVALPPSLVLGCAIKGMALLSPKARNRLASLKHLHCSKSKIYNKPEGAMTSLGFQRRPGDEKTLSIEKEAMGVITALFNEEGIPWWVDCGTCLGAYRYGGAIPWDGDIDLAVLQEDFHRIWRLLGKLDPTQYQVQDWSTRDYPDSFIKVYVRKSGSLIDIYHFSFDEKAQELRYIFSLDNHLFFPEWLKIRERRFTKPVAYTTVFPLKKADFDGYEVFVPCDTKKYLQRCYGENLDPVKTYNPQTGRYEKDLSHPYWQKAFVH